MKLFTSLVSDIVGMFSVPERRLNKPTTRNTRDANNFVHAKTLAREKRSASRVLPFEKGGGYLQISIRLLTEQLQNHCIVNLF